ncbi:hypothetical protein [Pseudodesulfovibrio sp.]|uniref:hypothetical protein n=1 Tax=Pseudodesulfovibrio sp. TaxID=2035812 RepID=UPI00261BA86E|nr:hypothetical protein [Pseudodesulfovibrio sp.]MDD3313157.1 hypothetical protein [Pseudodesulfovibrio sp.]
MPRQSADQLFDRLLADADFARTVAEAQDNPALQDALKREYNLTERSLSEAALRKFPLPDDMLDELSGGLLSELTFKAIAGKAIYGALTGGAAGVIAGGPKGAVVGIAVGAVAGAGGKVLEEAIDSLVNWKW